MPFPCSPQFKRIYFDIFCISMPPRDLSAFRRSFAEITRRVERLAEAACASTGGEPGPDPTSQED